jgi:hypothetical protein
MEHNTDLPEGWSMPDYMAKRISESINKKRITPEDELQDAFRDLANDLVLIEPDPRDWGWWVSYLLEQLDEEAERRGKKDEFARMLKALRQKLGN